MGGLDRLPAWATTGVGSLPFTDPAAAVAHSVTAYDLPFCPQLPRLEGDMIAEWLGADPGRCGWSSQRDRELPVAWTRFVAALEADPPTHGWVKLQVTGPLTLACALERDASHLGCGPEVITLAREVSHWLAATVGKQVQRVRAAGLRTLLVADEPGLASTGVGPGHADVWDPLRALSPGAFGLHVCGAVPWRIVVAAELELISFDVLRAGHTPAAHALLAAHVRRGGRVAWGVIDPVSPGTAAAAAARAAGAVRLVSQHGPDVATLAAHSLLTSSCGTGRLAPSQEHQIAATLAAAADATRAAAGAQSRSSPRLRQTRAAAGSGAP